MFGSLLPRSSIQLPPTQQIKSVLDHKTPHISVRAQPGSNQCIVNNLVGGTTLTTPMNFRLPVKQACVSSLDKGAPNQPAAPHQLHFDSRNFSNGINQTDHKAIVMLNQTNLVNAHRGSRMGRQSVVVEQAPTLFLRNRTIGNSVLDKIDEQKVTHFKDIYQRAAMNKRYRGSELRQQSLDSQRSSIEGSPPKQSQTGHRLT